MDEPPPHVSQPACLCCQDISSVVELYPVPLATNLHIYEVHLRSPIIAECRFSACGTLTAWNSTGARGCQEALVDVG